MRRRDRVEWRDAARAARTKHPTEHYVIQFAAEAELDEILNDEGLQRTKLFKPGERERLKAAADDIRTLFDKSLSVESTFGVEEAAVCGNLVVALFELDELLVALDIAKTGLDRSRVTLICSSELRWLPSNSEIGRSRKSLDAMEPSQDRTILAFRFYSDENDWAAIVDLAKDKGNIPEIERPLIETIARIAACKLQGGDVLRKCLPSIAVDVANDPRASIVIADFARMEGLEDLSEGTFLAAKSAIRPESHIAARVMVAEHPGRRGA